VNLALLIIDGSVVAIREGKGVKGVEILVVFWVNVYMGGRMMSQTTVFSGKRDGGGVER